jgi:AraC-like DNA-binding protein
MAETSGGNRTCELAEDWAKAARENDHHGHPRMFDVARHLRLHCSDRAQTSLERLAQVAHLSPSRLMHVFTRFFGIPLRAYVRQLRVDRAVNALAAGHSVTEAAYIAGFADASHLTRTVRRTFGVTPRQVLAFVAAAGLDPWSMTRRGSSDRGRRKRRRRVGVGGVDHRITSESL